MKAFFYPFRPVAILLISWTLVCGAWLIPGPSMAAPGGTLRTDFRTFYFLREKQGKLPDSEAFSQAMMLRYKSPFLHDVVALDASWFGNLKLVGEDGEGGTGLLQDLDDGSQASYAKLAEVMLKFRLSEAAQVKLGRMVVATPLLNDPDYRATPTSSQAAMFFYTGASSSIYGGVSDRGAAYTETDFGRYTDSNGDSFNIYTLGANHRLENTLFLEAALGHADNVLNQAYVNIRYPWQINDELKLMFDAYHYRGIADGEGALSGLGRNHDSALSNIATQLSSHSARLTFSLQTVRGDSYQTSWDGGVHDDTSFLSWHSVQRLNFDRAGENSWQLRFGYDFSGPWTGLTAMARYISGMDIERSDGRKGSEWERDIDFIYAPPGIDNLSFRWRYAVVRSSETFDSDEHRFIINYSFSVP